MEKMPFWCELRAMVCVLSCRRGQGSLEYIMMLSAVSIIVVIALAMMSQLKGAAMHGFLGSSNQSIVSQLSNELVNISRPN